jgi:hypothetical protein
MANPIDPMVTALATSGKLLKMSTSMEFDLGEHGVDRMPLISLLAENMEYDQLIPFQIDVEAAQKGVNLWTAPAEGLRARAVVIVCILGGGGILINPDGDPLPFPISTADPANPAWIAYANPGGVGLSVDVGGTPTPTGPGIDKITVDTELESRFQGYVFV